MYRLSVQPRIACRLCCLVIEGSRIHFSPGTTLNSSTPGHELNYAEINTESFLTSVTSILFSHLSHSSSSILSVLIMAKSSLCSFPPEQEFNNRSRNEHRIIYESAYL